MVISMPAHYPKAEPGRCHHNFLTNPLMSPYASELQHVEAHFDDFVSLNQLTSQKTAVCHSRLNSEIALLLSLSLTSGPFIPPPLCS